jgi:hypothetical protein
MELITEDWEMSKNMVSFGTRAHAFHGHLQADFKNEFLSMQAFGVITSMTKFRRRQAFGG